MSTNNPNKHPGLRQKKSLHKHTFNRIIIVIRVKVFQTGQKRFHVSVHGAEFSSKENDMSITFKTERNLSDDHEVVE